MNITLNHAERYVKNGWSVIPLRPKGKEPLFPWKKYSEQRPSSEDLASWFTAEATANIGIVTGAISQLIVVDIDSPEGLSYAQKNGLISPVYSTTGKGRHYYFRHPGKEVGNTIKLLPGIDTRADGGYVAAPPSIHPSGRRYTWGSAFLDSTRLPPFPAHLFEKEEKKQEGWISEALQSLTKGNRNDTFTRIVGRLHRDRWSADDITGLLRPAAAKVGFPETELGVIIASVTRYRDIQSAQIQQDPDDTPVYVHNFTDSADEYYKRKSARERGIEFPTGFQKFDRLIGGLRRQELLTVAARTGVGKTNWLIRAAEHLCRQGKSVLYFATEMSFDSIWERYIVLSSLNSRGYKDDKFLVCDDFIPSIARVEEAVKQVMPDVVMFDHINHVGDEQIMLSQFMKDLKRLARKYDLPGIVAAQLNRQADWLDPQTREKVIPRLSMIKGSGTIEQASGQVLLLSEVSTGPDENDIIGNLDKNRYGEKDLISFALKKNPYRMEEIAE